VAGQAEVDVGWFLSGDVWGRGYATEMALEAIRTAFELLALDDLVCFTTPANVASLAVMRKLGRGAWGDRPTQMSVAWTCSSGKPTPKTDRSSGRARGASWVVTAERDTAPRPGDT